MWSSRQSWSTARKCWMILTRLSHTHPRFVRLVLGAIIIKLCFVAFPREKAPYLASCTKQGPFITIKPDFLNQTDFEKVLHACVNHPWIGPMLDSDVYPKTTEGWVVKFNREGFSKMEQDARFDGLAAVLNKVLEKDANAVVVRLVVGGSTVDGDLMVARHHDENLRFTPHDVSVLYLATPRDMLGGELVVWPGVTAEKVLRKKPAVVWPVKNVLVKFRGDSEHKVRGFASVFGEKRISLVIEQYCIPKKKYQLTVEYCVNETCF